MNNVIKYNGQKIYYTKKIQRLLLVTLLNPMVGIKEIKAMSK